MKYKIGQELRHNWSDEKEPDCKIICLGLFDDGKWKYGVHEYGDEYNDMVDFYTEKELEENYEIVEN